MLNAHIHRITGCKCSVIHSTIMFVFWRRRWWWGWVPGKTETNTIAHHRQKTHHNHHNPNQFSWFERQHVTYHHHEHGRCRFGKPQKEHWASESIYGLAFLIVDPAPDQVMSLFNAVDSVHRITSPKSNRGFGLLESHPNRSQTV